MEKTTKKRKKSKSLRRRIGIVAIGGLSLVLTVCLSVGATLAWFAGSTWADKSLYMGGPVYVEMAGKGISGSTGGTGGYGDSEAKWMGGSGSLDISAVARSTGTTSDSLADAGLGTNNSTILLPGQRLQVYSQARVFSTAGTTSLNAGARPNQSSGSNTTNTSNATSGTYTYTSSEGRVTTATTSVLRARFSINIEFDPSVGFNNFTDYNYMSNYPVKSSNYTGDVGYTFVKGTDTGYLATSQWTGTKFGTAKGNNEYGLANTSGLSWSTALVNGAAVSVGQDGNPVYTDDYFTGVDGEGNVAYGVPYTVDTTTTYQNVAYTRGETYKVVYASTFNSLTAEALDATATKVYVYNAESANEDKYDELSDATTVTKATVITGIKATIDNDKTNDEANKNYQIARTSKVYTTVRTEHGRRDTVEDTTFTAGTSDSPTITDGVVTAGGNGANDFLSKIARTELKSIYRWKYVSAAEYAVAEEAEKMGFPFNGEVSGFNTDGTYIFSSSHKDKDGKVAGVGNGFYGLWVLDGSDNKTESDAFYKARCNAYLTSYVEDYVDEYGRDVKRTIGTQLQALENSLNEQFEQLINDSSDNILAGHVNGFTVNETTQQTTQAGDANPQNASWLYIDPSIGRDTNTSEISTSKGGWWYLVASTGSVNDGENKINKVTDTATGFQDGGQDTDFTMTNDVTRVPGGIMRADDKDSVDTNDNNDIYEAVPAGDGTEAINGTYLANNNPAILEAELFEVAPDIDLGEVVGNNNGTAVTKVVSVSFPFVNGSFTLPSKALTNIFANAKITFQISFQALQAFFPYTESIDGIDYHWDLLGKEKALNIKNAIPIYNEAFDI